MTRPHFSTPNGGPSAPTPRPPITAIFPFPDLDVPHWLESLEPEVVVELRASHTEAIHVCTPEVNRV